MTIYVITYGDTSHGLSIFGATVDKDAAERLAEQAERHYHNCYGGPLCVPEMAPVQEGRRSREVVIYTFEDPHENDGSREDQ